MPQLDPIEPGSHEWEVARNRAELQGFIPEIRLTPANEALKAELIAGMEQVLFGPESHTVTVEGTDTDDNFRLGHTKFLARVAFLHLDNAPAASADRPFDLALGTFAMHLDMEKLSEMDEEVLKNLGYDTFDGVYSMMLDTLLENNSRRSIHHGARDGRYGFQYYENINGPSSGYRHIPELQTGDVFKSAYQIDTGYQKNRSETGFGSYLEELHVVADILKNGQPDQAPIDKLAQAAQEEDAITIVPEGSDVAEKILSFMYGMFKEAVETPGLRDEIARHQYWHAQKPGYLLR